MPALNFKKQFAPKIISGEKRQTIRATRKHPIKVGDRLYLYTGMRTQNCIKLGEAYCIETHKITIRQCTLTDKKSIQIDEYELSEQMVHELAIADGFTKVQDFMDFFLHSPKSTYMMRVRSWSGEIIKWGMLCKP